MKTIREMAEEYAAAEYEEPANRACAESDYLAGVKAALEIAIAYHVGGAKSCYGQESLALGSSALSEEAARCHDNGIKHERHALHFRNLIPE